MAQAGAIQRDADLIGGQLNAVGAAVEDAVDLSKVLIEALLVARHIIDGLLVQKYVSLEGVHQSDLPAFDFFLLLALDFVLINDKPHRLGLLQLWLLSECVGRQVRTSQELHKPIVENLIAVRASIPDLRAMTQPELAHVVDIERQG